MARMPDELQTGGRQDLKSRGIPAAEFLFVVRTVSLFLISHRLNPQHFPDGLDGRFLNTRNHIRL